MRLTPITSPQFVDQSGKIWSIRCNEYMSCYKEHMDKIVAVTQDAYNKFTRMGAFHFWIRLNEGKSITGFTNMLKKHYQVNNNYDIAYIRVKEYDEDNMHEHHHFMLYLDTHKSREYGFSYLINKHVGKDKHLMNYRIEPWRLGTKRPWRIIKTEQDLEDVINRASYLAKTRSKRIGAGQVTISTSRVREQKNPAD